MPDIGGRIGADPGPDPALSRSSRNSALVAAGILLSRLSGLVREKLLGYFLGVGPVVDAFRVAVRIPNLMQNLLGEGVLSASFIPVHARLLAEGREQEAGRVAGAVAALLALVAGLLVVVGVVFARPVTSVIAFGFPQDGSKFELTVTLVRILTPGVGFLVLSAWCLGVLNSYRRFFLSYVAPVLWNAAMIAVLVALGISGASDRSLAVGLAWGALAGGAAQLAAQLPAVLRLSSGLRPNLDLGRAGVRQTIRAFGPVVAGRGVVQLSAYLDVFIASFLATGAIAALGYAQVLYVLPISLFGMSIAAAELPELSAMDASDRAAVSSRLRAGLARMAFLVVPTTVGYFLLGDLIVGMLFQGGEFGPLESVQVWAILAAYALSLLASTGSRLLQSALYGVGDTRRPALVAVARVVVSSTLGLLLMLQFDRLQVAADGTIVQVAGLPTLDFPDPLLRDADRNLLRLGAVGLALGSAAGAWFEYTLLRRFVDRDLGEARLGGGRLGRILAAAVPAAGVGLGVRVLTAGWTPWLAGPVAIVATGGAYVAIAAVLGLPEVDEVVRLFRRYRGPAGPPGRSRRDPPS